MKQLPAIKTRTAWAIVNRRGDVLLDTVKDTKAKAIRAYMDGVSSISWEVVSMDDGFTVEHVVISAPEPSQA